MNILNENATGYNYKYTDLAEIHRYLEHEGLTYYQTVETDANGNDYIVTVPIDSAGAEMKPRRGCRIVQARLKNNDNPAQEQGSGITYARRYSLLMAFGLCTDDDDAETYSNRSGGLNDPISESHIEILTTKARELGLKFNPRMYGKERIEDLTEAEYGRALNALKDFAG